MRTLAIGDIHGCLTALETLLAVIHLDPEDTLVTLGDYVDRGPDTSGVLDLLIGLQQKVHLVPLRGNHELMMLKACDNPGSLMDWKLCGGDATLSSYGALNGVPLSHWDFLEKKCVAGWEMETHFFVHAGVYAHLPLWQQTENVLFWQKFDNPPPHQSGKVMVCGHTSQKNGLPRNLGHAVCIDTWAYGTGWLTCLEVASGKLWQANQQGEQRQFLLEELPQG